LTFLVAAGVASGEANRVSVLSGPVLGAFAVSAPPGGGFAANRTLFRDWRF